MSENTIKKDFFNGFKIGIPICLGYIAVAFSLGITASRAGLSAMQSALASILLNASAGEYTVFEVIASGGGYLEIALAEFVANCRYLLMSCALSQKLSSKARLPHRMLMGFAVTDELFGASIGQEGRIAPAFYFGMMAIAVPGWCLGTWCGAALGNILPLSAVNALSVGLYGMFIAIMIPAAKKKRAVLIVVAFSMLLSIICSALPVFSSVSYGTKIIILTVVISSAAALIFPLKEDGDEK